MWIWALGLQVVSAHLHARGSSPSCALHAVEHSCCAGGIVCWLALLAMRCMLPPALRAAAPAADGAGSRRVVSSSLLLEHGSSSACCAEGGEAPLCIWEGYRSVRATGTSK